MMAQMHPTDKWVISSKNVLKDQLKQPYWQQDSFKFVAALFQESPVVVDMNDGTIRRYVLPTDLPVDEDGVSDKDKDQQISEK
jgi:hypothetical protein